MALRVKKLSAHATLPVRGSALAAGYDLARYDSDSPPNSRLTPSSAYEAVIPARGQALVKTDLAMIIPSDCYGRIGTNRFSLICL